MKFRTAILIAVIFSSPCARGGDFEFSDGEPVSLRSDTAYILVRTFKRSPILVRALSNDELNHAKDLAQRSPDNWSDSVQPNVVAPSWERSYADDGSEEVLLTSARPGTYVFGGFGVNNRVGGLATASFCMGTVKFEARPGVITDLGTMVSARDNRATTIPELANWVSGKDLGFVTIPDAVAIRPATSSTELPDQLKSLPRIFADYRAVTSFPNYLGAPLSRLAPMVGVLAYDKDGNVLDLKASQSLGH